MCKRDVAWLASVDATAATADTIYITQQRWAQAYYVIFAQCKICQNKQVFFNSTIKLVEAL